MLVVSFFVLLICLNVSILYGLDNNAGAGVYGIAGYYFVNGSSALVKYNITSGATTTIRPPTASDLLCGENLACFDNKFNLWYFVSNANGKMTLNPYNLNNPQNRIKNVLLPQIEWVEVTGAGVQCAGDPNTGDIYVFGHSSQDQSKQILLRLVRNSLNDTITPIQIGSYDNINDTPLIPGSPYIFDNKRNCIWFSAEDDSLQKLSYYYLNATDGKLLNEVGEGKWPLEQAQYSKTMDFIVGINRKHPQLPDGYWSFNLGYADPVTLEIKKQFDPFDGEYCGMVSITSIDEENQIFYSLLLNPHNKNEPCPPPSVSDVYLLGVNITDGTLISKSMIAQWSGTNLTMPNAILYWNGQ